MYRFLLTPRWLGGTALALVAIVVCLLLGSWQLGRFEERASSHKAVRAATAPAAAQPLDQVLDDGHPQVTTDSVGREVVLSGTYDAAHQLLVPDRTVDGRQGYYVLTPLRTADGRAVAVVRGWVPGRRAPRRRRPAGRCR